MTAAQPHADEVFAREIAGTVVEALNLEGDPATIDLDASLFGEGLGLDSIDILEMALVISKKYGIELRADDEHNMQIFASLRSLATHVAKHRESRAAA
jgi:acyl carrier protein